VKVLACVGLLLVSLGAVQAQSRLPLCPTDSKSRWHDCRGEHAARDATYVGEFRNGVRHGRGTVTWISGQKYEGQFADGKVHGQGVLYSPEGSIELTGYWEENRFLDVLPAGWASHRRRYLVPLILKIPIEIMGEAFPFLSDPDLEELAAGERTFALKLQRLTPTGLEILAGIVRPAVQTSAVGKPGAGIREGDASRPQVRDLEMKLEAADREKKRLEMQLSSVGEGLKPHQAVGPKNPHALVIGNAAYPGSARLDNPINDSTAVAQKLRTMGFTVTEVRDATRQRLVQAMGHFRKTASDADLSLLFYSGHGVQIYGTNYILPIDVDQNDVAQATLQGISLNSVVENFLPGKTKIIFLDACRDNPLMRTGDRSVSRGLAPISVAQGTLISYATKDGQTAADGTGQKNSPFTKALLEHLGDPSDIAVILRRVRGKVMLATGGKQQPWEYGSLTGGELILTTVPR
jgi:hypothetical protein